MAKGIPPKGEVLSLLAEAKKPVHARELATKLGVSGANVERLIGVLDDLVDERKVKRAGGQRYAIVTREERESESWEGMLSLNPRGFGFVNAVGHDDAYIAPEAICAAMHGDRVKISVVNRTTRGVEGRIEHVITRRN